MGTYAICSATFWAGLTTQDKTDYGVDQSTYYTDLGSWETARITGTLSEPEIAMVIENITLDSAVTVSGATASQTNYVEIAFHPSIRHSGKWDDDSCMFSVNGNALTVWVDYFRLTGAQLDLSASGSMGVYLSANYMSIDKSILKGGNWGVYINSGYSGIVIKNSIFQDTVRAPVGLTGTTTDVVEILNCTGWNYNTSNYSNAGFCRLGANGQAKIINTIGVASSVSLINDFTSNYTYASGTGYNCSEDDSAPGSNSIHLDTDGAVLDFVSTTAGSEHFMLKSTSDMVDAGSTVSTVTDDVIGTSRPVNSVYDIGAYEYDPTIGLPVPFTLSNLVLYSRVIIQEQDGTVLYGPVEADSTSETGTLEYFEDITVIVKARRASSELGDGTIYRDFRQEASLTANGLNVYVSQQIDGVLN